MKFTSEDLMKAMGLQVGDRVKIYSTPSYSNIYTVVIDKEEGLSLVDTNGEIYLMEYIVNLDFEILPRPKRVGDLNCNDFNECDSGCPLRWLCCNNQHEEHNCDITLYEVLERHKIDDKEVYNVFKNRLDKEVV